MSTREGFALWTTTSQIPPLRKLAGEPRAPPGATLPYGDFSETTELEPAPESPSPTSEPEDFWARAARGPRRDADTLARKMKHVAERDRARGKEGPLAGARKRLTGARRRIGRVGQRIKQFVRPLEMLQFVATLFINVTYFAAFGVAAETFSIPRCAAALANLFERWIEPFGHAAEDRGSARGEEKVRRDGGRRRAVSDRIGNGHGRGQRRSMDERLGPISPAKLKEGLKHAKRWGGKVVGGMRRSFSSQEDLRRDQARRVEYLVKEGRRLNEMCDSAGAVNAFRQAVAIRPNDAILLVCLSKSLSDQVFTEEVFHDHALARALSSEAAAISEEAVALKPTYAEAHLSLGAALGRLSMWSDNREKVELSRSIKERCEEAIRLDPESDLALHVLARFEHQMANLGRIVRLLVRAMYGNKLSPGTLEGAEALFRRAVALRPTRLIHRVELGKLLLDAKRPDEAKAELELAVTLPREDVNSEHERRDAVELLKKHWGIRAEVPTFEDIPPTPPPKRRTSGDGDSSPWGGFGSRRASGDGDATMIPEVPGEFEGDSARGSPADSARSASPTPSS